MTREYRVQWEIDLAGESPTDAAKAALEIQRDSASTATRYVVAARDGGRAAEVDLWDGWEGPRMNHFFVWGRSHEDGSQAASMFSANDAAHARAQFEDEVCGHLTAAEQAAIRTRHGALCAIDGIVQSMSPMWSVAVPAVEI